MAPRDRTHEFHSTLNSIKSRSTLSHPQAYSLSNKAADAGAKQKLLPNGAGAGGVSSASGSPALGGPAGKGAQQGKKSEFARMAGQIGKDINATTIKLQKLAQLAKRKTLFDDRPVEISELTYIIRQDISSLNTQIAQLQGYLKQQKAASSAGNKGKEKSGQVEEHNSNVVMMLQSRLASMGMGFKDVLELRTQNMKASKDRTEQFMHTASSAAVPAPPQNSVLYSSAAAASSVPSLPATSALLQPIDRKGKARAANFSSAPGTGRSSPFPGANQDQGAAGGGDFLALDIDGDGGENGLGKASGGYQQMQLVEQQDNYIQSRSTAIESIESTIAELGQIFSQLAGMVAEQRETVQRIDADTTDIAANVSGAQRELLKYYASVTSNRWLMLKIFGVLIIFFLLFILVS